MVNPRDIRRLAMQVLYQIDLRGEGDLEAICAGLVDGFDVLEIQETGFELAAAAWAAREQADKAVADLAPQWPTHRQPPVDRAILRLAHYEMISGRTPVKVVINESIELAKQYGSEQSASFVNGVLDKLGKPLLQASQSTQEESVDTP